MASQESIDNFLVLVLKTGLQKGTPRLKPLAAERNNEKIAGALERWAELTSSPLEAKEIGTSIGRALAAAAPGRGLDLWPLELVLGGLSFRAKNRAERLGYKNQITDIGRGHTVAFYPIEGTWMLACWVAEAVKDVAQKDRVQGWVMDF